MTPRLFTLDIPLKGCHFTGLNRRYTDTLMATSADNSAQFSLMAYALQEIRRGGDVATVSCSETGCHFDATLRPQDVAGSADELMVWSAA